MKLKNRAMFFPGIRTWRRNRIPDVIFSFGPEKVEADRIVLSASSDYFSQILHEHDYRDPIVQIVIN